MSVCCSTPFFCTSCSFLYTHLIDCLIVCLFFSFSPGIFLSSHVHHRQQRGNGSPRRIISHRRCLVIWTQCHRSRGVLVERPPWRWRETRTFSTVSIVRIVSTRTSEWDHHDDKNEFNSILMTYLILFSFPFLFLSSIQYALSTHPLNPPVFVLVLVLFSFSI